MCCVTVPNARGVLPLVPDCGRGVSSFCTHNADRRPPTPDVNTGLSAVRTFGFGAAAVSVSAGIANRADGRLLFASFPSGPRLPRGRGSRFVRWTLGIEASSVVQ